MNLQSEPHEVAKLAMAMCDERLTSEQRDRLSALLTADRTARLTYLNYLHAEAFCYRLLRASGLSIDPENPAWAGAQAAGGQIADSPESDVAATSLDDAWIHPAIREPKESGESDPLEGLARALPAGPLKIRSGRRASFWDTLRSATGMRWAAAIAASILLAASLLVWEFTSGHDRGGGALTLVSPQDAQWDGLADAPAVGGTLPAGTLTLASGTVCVSSSAGATISLQGPVKFEMTSPTNLLLLKGQLLADVPHELKNFVVQTPNAKVVDLGTEFGVSVDSAGLSEVQVLQGRVLVVGDADAGKGNVFAAGSACRVNTTGHQAPAPFDAHRFEFAARANGSSPYDRWLSYGRELCRDPALVAYYTFEKDAARPAVLVNAAPAHRASDGAIENAQWSDGRFPGKSGLYFPGNKEWVKVNIPGQFHGLTLWTWLRTDGNTPHEYNTILAADSFDTIGQLHWNLTRDRLQIGIAKPRPTLQEAGFLWNSGKSIVTWPSRQWAFLASVIDGRTVRFYRDGKLASPPVTNENFDTAEGIQIGAAEIGNFSSYLQFNNGPRNFHGSFDELGVLSRSMSDAEILRLFEAGRP